MVMPVTLVTVVFEAEVPLLELQARSVARFVSREVCRDVVVIDNTRRGLPGRARAALLSEYGDRADVVRFVRSVDIAPVRAAGGWHVQQVLKLLIADRLATSHYLVLDAKNHFVASLRREFLFGPDGRPRVNAYSYVDHPHRARLERVLRYLGVDPGPHIEWFTATVTPYLLDRQLVLNLIRGIEARSGRSFHDEFLRKELTEFLLYGGWVVAGGVDLDERFDLHQVFAQTLWPGSASAPDVRRVVARAREGEAPLFSVHRGALGVLDTQGTALLADFWTERGLFPTGADATQWLTGARRAASRAQRVLALKELPRQIHHQLQRSHDEGAGHGR